MREDIDFFASVRTSRGVYRPLKFALNDFLELGENSSAYVASARGGSSAATKSSEATFTVFEKSNDPEFGDKLKEAVGFLKAGLPAGTIMHLGILYPVNLIKQNEGKELLWFHAIAYEEPLLHAKLVKAPEQVKYLKLGGVVKPSLEKIDSFYFEET